jgi:hypothetical protein
MLRRPTKPPEGAKLKETADMIAWRKEFEKLSTDDHISKLSALGLDDEDMEEFKKMKAGAKVEDILGGESEGEEESITKSTAKTPEVKKKK